MDTDQTDAILAEYDARYGQNDDLRKVCERLLFQLLDNAGYRVHSITSRVKKKDSLRRKLLRPGKDYKMLADVTDVVGIRITTYFEDEVDRVGDLIQKEFEVDKLRLVDKRLSLDADRFGYLSLHYVCCLCKERLRLAEYRPYHDMPCEILIRSVLQHAWAEIEHDLGYKAAAGVPTPIRRRFSRLAGLLEIADREFAEIRDVLAQYSSGIKEQIAVSPSTVGIDTYP
jgi:ppGpp synthetase/RelA/SpoT-type nucleotidyltranferase